MTQSLTQTDGENGQVWYPLSAAQQQLWFFSHMEADSRAYNIGGWLWLEGPLDMAVLREVLNAVVERNEMLRATFRDFQGRPAQMIRPMQPIEIDLIDLSDQENAEQLAVEQGHQLILDVYNITEDELFRQRLYRIAPDRHILAMACHHIVADAWAFGVLLREMISRYESIVCETKLRLPRLTRSYFDVVLKQQEWLKSDKAATQAEYWRDYLGDQHSPLSLPTQRASNSVELAQHQLLPVDAGLVAQLDKVADELEVSRFTLLLGALHLVLARLSGQDEIRIGVPNANRSARTAAVYGFFVNNWVIAAKPQAQLSLKDFILQVGAALDGAKAHGQLPFESLLEVIEPERHPGCHPLFQAAFNYRHRHQGGEQAWDINGLTMRFDEMPVHETPFSLVLDISPSLDDGLMLRFITAKGVFSEDLVDQLSQGYRRALRQLAELQRPSLAAMDILSEDDHRILQSWSTQPYDYEQGRTLPELIAAQAASRPDAVALVHGDTRIRFAELEARSNQLAHWLIAQGIAADQVVGLSLPRGVEMIIGFLGILKAGGAFLPLDPDYPQERLCYMLEDSGAKLLLTNKALLNALPVDGLRRVALDDLDLIHQPDNTPRIQLHADQLAYLIYTSGSTGKPKGVCLTHAGLNMHVQTIGERYGMTPEDVELHFASISFDGAVERWTVPLAFGSRLVIRDQQLWSAEETCQALQKEGVTIACFPPSYVGPLLDWIEHSQPELKVRSWTLGGEAFTRETYERLQQVLKPQRIINGYGPTETVVTPMIWEAYSDTDMDSAYAPIGTAVGERRLYILDGNLNPVAPGIVGELYIGGEIGLARGYHGRPDLTAERFLPDPWGEAGERMYRTGDLVRWREDGVMEYQGRVDHQIKIRGFRIELGEIEARLLANPQVAEATVVAQAAPGGDRLVGYVVPKGPLDLEQLKTDLESALPDYMVPSQILSLDSLPLTPAGKVDRAALPQAQWQQQEYEAPQTEAEKALASIWAQLLGVERIGRQDQFFELGGDSIIALQVVSRARQAGWAISPRDLFEQRDLKALAASAKAAGQSAIPQKPLQGDVALLPIQSRFLKNDGAALCNQYLRLSLAQPLQAEPLRAALQALLEQHDVLRLRFENTESGWQASYQPVTAQTNNELLWLREVHDAEVLKSCCDEAQQSLDIERGELLRAVYMQCEGEADQLLLTIHHLAVDGVSWRILLEDLWLAYEQAAAGRKVQLPAKTHSQRDWADLLQQWAKGPAEQQRDYWQSATAELPQLWGLDLNAQPLLREHHLQLSAELSERLGQVARQHLRSSLEDVLIMALARVLAQHSGRDALCIHRESHGREDSLGEIDLSRTVGWFTSLYPQRLQLQDDPVSSLKAMKEQLHAVREQGLAYGALRQWGEADLSAERIDVLFNYLGVQQSPQAGVEIVDAGLWRPQGSAADAPLVINAHQQDGALQLHWEFAGAFPEPRQHQLLDGFVRELKNLVALCEQHGPWLTPGDVALSGLDQETLDHLPAGRYSDILPLSPLQQGLLFHVELSGRKDLYINQLTLPMRGLDIDRLKQAWQSMLQRHPVLRSALLPGDSAEPLQAVWTDMELPWQLHDLRGGDVDLWCEQRRLHGFELHQAPLWAVDLLQTADDEYHCVFTVHHLIMDGWSTGTLLGELLQHYHGISLPGAPSDYGVFLAWLQQQDRVAAEDFWQSHLQGLSAPSYLLAAVGSESTQSDYRRHDLCFDAEQQQRLQDGARRQGITLSTLVQGAWALILGQYTAQQQVVFGNTVAGRPPQLPGSERMLGLFINTLPVAVDLSAAQPATAWLQQLQQTGMAAREHDHLPLSDIQRLAGYNEGLFDTLVVFENYPLDPEALNSSAQALQIGEPHSYEFTHYPLTVAVMPGKDLHVVFAHNAAQLPEALIDQMSAAFAQVLLALAEQQDAPLAQLPRITETQQQRLENWAVQPYQYDDAQTLPSLIAAQAASRPDAVALVHGDTRIRFAELEARSNQLAHWLIGQGIAADQVVGLSLPRGVEMIIGFLGVLKAGGAFLPLDPDYPQERLCYMLEDSGAKLLLTNKALLNALPADGLRRVALDDLDLIHQPDNTPRIALHADQLAYLIYTSGSTGKPKGVCLTHAGLNMHVQTIGERYGMTPDDVELHFASISFDGAVERWTVPLAFGSRLVIRDQQLWSAEETCQVLQKEGVTIACFPPSYVGPLLDWIEHSQPELKVRSWTLGGEAFTRETYERLQQVLKPQRIINGYGPTETVVTPMIWEAYSDTNMDSAYAPIGTAVGERRLYILDGNFNPVAPGIVGELYIGGEIGLARGYHGRPDLTAERFLPDPWGEAGERMYRTGDLVRWCEDGVMEYQGRVDHQIKIRGFRIELGEIEARLLANPQVAEATVVAQAAPGGDRLVGYVVPKGPLDLEQLKGDLESALPDYMVPSQILSLDSLPLTPAGKVDRAALPQAQWQQQEYEAPQTEAEKALASIWAQLLGVERIGRQDQFFELGGHSLLATQTVGLLRRDHQLQLSLQDLFDRPRLADCAACVQNLENAGPGIEAVARDGDLPVSAAQRRLWFMQQLDPNNRAYHMPLGLEIQGELDLNALQTALDHLVGRHEILRTVFVDKGGEPRQRILDDHPVAVEMRDLRGQPQLAAEPWWQGWLQQPFDLATGPLLRLGVLRLEEQRYRLLLVQHHIISDGRSSGFFLESLMAFYRAALENTAVDLTPPTLQYADYAVWQQQWLQSAAAEGQLAYWRERLGEDDTPLDLPTDFPRGSVEDVQGARLHFSLSGPQLAGLKALAQAHDTSLFVPLLGLWQVLLYRYSGQSDIRVGVPVAGRSQADSSDMLGCFINMLVMRGELGAQLSFNDLLQQLKALTSAAQQHQDLPFERLVEALSSRHQLQYHPLFQVAFNHQHLASSQLKDWPQAEVSAFDPGVPGAQFDLALDTELHDDGSLRAYISYSRALYKDDSIERLRDHLLQLANAVIVDAGQSIAQLPLLTDAEHRRLRAWNETAKDWGEFIPLPLRQSLQAAKTPNAVALSYADQQLSYTELENRVNQLAHRLQSAGVGPDVRVAISLPRSVELVVGILAIVRAGGAYVPLDPGYPPERLRYILESAEPALLLMHSSQAELAAGLDGLPCWSLDKLDCSDEPGEPPVVDWRPDQPMYVIYTSGSTGRPKGVVNHHAALENRLLWMQAEYPLNGSDCVMQKTPFSFDVSVWEFFWPFITGARLAVAEPEAHGDPAALQRLIAEQNVTTLHFVPSMLQVFMAQTALAGCDSLKRIICSGEALGRELQQQVLGARPDIGLHNLYGPTEAAIDVSYWRCREDERHSVPIGEPISNTQLHVLDEQLNPMPIGVPGELYLAGIGLATAYYGRADLTAERFVPNPYGEPGSRMYRSGDKVRRTAEGVIEYLGRLDHQVKIRGLRIELGEIENRLQSLEQIADAAVVAQRHNNSDLLVAYVVLHGAQSENWQTELKAALAESLPDYMLPSVFMDLQVLPLSPNGKLDRKALPMPQWQRRSYRAPETDLQQQLAAIWQTLLEQPQIGLDDNFFALGGHSLLATRAVAQIRESLNLDISLRAFFESDSLEALAVQLEADFADQQKDEKADLDVMASLLDELEGV